MTDSTVRYSLGEELAHSITHGIGAALSIAGLVLLVTLAAIRGDAWHVVSCSIFGATLVFLYTASTLYHSITHPGAKRVLRVFDHAAIFLLIAGTYTPFTLVTLRGGWGWTLFIIVWGLALVGIIYKITAKNRFRFLSVLLYLAMGWLVLIAIGLTLSFQQRFDPSPQFDVRAAFPIQRRGPLGRREFHDSRVQDLNEMRVAGHEWLSGE